MINKRHIICPSPRQRRRAHQQAQAILAQTDTPLLAATLFIVCLFPFLIHPHLLFDLPAWLWWVKGYAWMGLLAGAAVRLLVGLPLVPAQLTGATVAAMTQAAPEPKPIPWKPPASQPVLSSWRQPPAQTERETRTRLQTQWRQQRQRPFPCHRTHSPLRPFLPPPSRRPHPSV